MANQYNFNGNDDFERRRQETQNKANIFRVICVIAAVVIVLFLFNSQKEGFGNNYFPTFLVLGGVYAVIYSIGNSYNDKAKALGASSSGREIVKQSLSALPDNYSVLSNVELNHAGKNVVFDTIVIGDTGVFVIGSCNRNGDLDGQESSPTWVQHKVGRGGTPYSNEFKNPFKKLYFQKKFLEEFLSDNGLPVEVGDYLIIPLADSYTCTSRKVGRNQDDIIQKIESSKKETLTKEKLNDIFYTIKNHR